MAPPVIDKLRKIKNKTKEPKQPKEPKEPMEPKEPKEPKGPKEPKQPKQPVDTDHNNNERPPKSQLGRILGSAANRTFLTASPRTSSTPYAADMSPITIQDVEPTKIDALSLDDADDGTEAYFRPGEVPGVRVGACTTAGWQLSVDTSGSGQTVRVRKKNQDSYGVEQFFGGLLAVVYDGHGAHGRGASQLARDIVPQVLKDNLRHQMEKQQDNMCGEERRRLYVKTMTKAFVECERALKESQSIDDSYSGTTTTAVWLDRGDMYVAWTGDSRAVMGSATGGVDVTWDQKPTRSDEKKRVRHAGGRVTRWKKNIGPQRVWLPDEWLPGLAMTRSIGDTVLSKYGVIPNPEVTITKLGDGEQFIVVASDGVWEFMSSEEVCTFVRSAREGGSSEDEIARALVREAVMRWNQNESVVDDTTAIVIFADGGKLEKRRETEGRRSVLRRKRQEFWKEAPAGVPWLICHNGRLEPFDAKNGVEDYDEE